MRLINDNYNNQCSASASATMVRQRFVVKTNAKADTQADGFKKRAASK
jgi:hypothetical protein